jgi:outer membrane protein
MINKWIAIGFGVLLFSLLGLCTAIYLKIPKTAYISTSQVYEGFNFKNELEAKFQGVKKTRESYLDSMKIELEMEYKELEEQKQESADWKKFQMLREQYFSKEAEFEQSNTELLQQYNDQIWERLNQYIKEYGEKNDYTYIFGATGEGSLMFALDGKNITEQILEHVNNQYEGNI